MRLSEAVENVGKPVIYTHPATLVTEPESFAVSTSRIADS